MMAKQVKVHNSSAMELLQVTYGGYALHHGMDGWILAYALEF